MFRADGPQQSWRERHLFRYPFQAIGKTREDVQEAYDIAVDQKRAYKKVLGIFPIGSELGLSVSKTERWVLKFKEIVAKTVGVILPVLGGLAFLGESEHLGDLMSCVGIAAIALGPILSYQAGKAYGEMHDWARDEGLPTVFFGSNVLQSR